MSFSIDALLAIRPAVVTERNEVEEEFGDDGGRNKACMSSPTTRSVDSSSPQNVPDRRPRSVGGDSYMSSQDGDERSSNSSPLVDCVDDDDNDVDDRRFCGSPCSMSGDGNEAVSDVSGGGPIEEMAVRSGGLFRNHQRMMLNGTGTGSGLPSQSSMLIQSHMLSAAAAAAVAAHRAGLPIHPGQHPNAFPFHAFNGGMMRHHGSAIPGFAVPINANASSAQVTGVPGRRSPSAAGVSSLPPGSPPSNTVGTPAASAFHSPSAAGNQSVSGRRGPAVSPSGPTSPADAALQRLAAQAAVAAAHQQHMHNLQLDWLARSGVYMPRLIDYNGILNTLSTELLHM